MVVVGSVRAAVVCSVGVVHTGHYVVKAKTPAAKKSVKDTAAEVVTSCRSTQASLAGRRSLAVAPLRWQKVAGDRGAKPALPPHGPLCLCSHSALIFAALPRIL